MRKKTVVLGVTGGIAAYKAAALTSQLTQKGIDTWVILTESAARFVTPLTFQTLSKHHVFVDTFEERDPAVVSHIDLADKADLFVIAPATANIIGKMAQGIADDMLSTTVLATVAPVLICPAMNVHMYAHPAVQRNMNILKEWGYHFAEPGEGPLACGYTGKGRLAESESILTHIEYLLKKGNRKTDLKGKRVLVTAGPTREKVDPVRFFSNRSSGKMGFAIAEAARDRGAEVLLVTGPTSLPKPSGVITYPVESAEEMYHAVMEKIEEVDIVIKAAAVADYRPKEVHDQKIKKSEGQLIIELERTKDILFEIGKRKKHQFVVGFAAETKDVEYYAKDKMSRKNVDMIVANNVKLVGAGFEEDTNVVTIYVKNGQEISLPKMSKREVADAIFDQIMGLLEQRE
ncbi:bifunctional phosphopantothenoylcysteine decarboxylase/phosphopantothenate--cysteine ligase CoaBC [Microaerobacter geothermalis]|uniref:bifunctional phosphopantothenoylcysteine decarboxylase/phosphopantothenate--cysteine ligase CoaBC n=1 Tax=Microaerobacter geothermalis TaxID=674972 RepID=UPI001F1CCD60|nr:bifunctional phosphopantothenoylcysteine decarboxylase/phosphopantothenate--cysteine ligase CoaBC [Microaerobacter geothermalis]MCF6094882.1 bifunctional phosphopantothenoylcysteine decarboxylase/phosphopantothenate--cysteine ligase CoaBC [Microaerobacter geothermalis]